MIYDVTVLGSGAAGLTACLYMCRAGYNVALVTGKEPFGNLGKIAWIENYPGINGIEGYQLALDMYGQLENFDNLTKYEFLSAISLEKSGDDNPNVVTLEDNTVIKSKSIIMCIGGEHKLLGLPNEEKYFGNGISVCATCDGPFYKNKSVAVIGGGNSALDYAITLSKYCKEVTIIHRKSEFRASNDMIEKTKRIPNISYIMNSVVAGIAETEKFERIFIKNNNSSAISGMRFDGMFYAIGFNRSFIAMSVSGLNDGIFSAGDYSDMNYRQVVIAAGDGCREALKCIKFLQSKNMEY